MGKIKTIKKIVLILLIAVMFSLFLSSCLAGRTLTENNNGDNIDLKVNDMVEIKLKSNPTAGYSWFLGENVDSSIVSVTGPEFIESKKDKGGVGAGGYEVFTIKATSKGKTNIILNYKRPWEEEVELIETFEIAILVD